MKKIKILIVAGHMNVGGIENQLMHLLRNADPDRYRIEFTTTADQPYFTNEIERLGSRCIHLPKTNRIHYLRYVKELYRVMKTGSYDIVHAHELFFSGLVLTVARLAKVPGRFVHAHNWSDDDGTGRNRSIVRKIYNNVMQKLILCNSTCQLACSTLAGRFLYGEDTLKKPTYHLVFNSVDTRKYLDHYDRTESGEFCDDGWINILQVGRFTEIKNQLFAAQIAHEFKKRSKKIRILCAGNTGTTYEDQVTAAIETLGIQDHMQLLGVRSDIDVLMRKSSAFLLPSLYEGMPLVLIEAQASGLPCVVADTFSHEVDFGIGNINWMQLSDGAAAWADAVEMAVNEERAAKKDVIRAVEEKRFDSRMFAKTLCDLYESAV